ncbi:MAG TPA: CAP domain-containing protein [Ferruginibacter sp.]|nr:CAP domain-containing protein [Ferruginibacter sp.]HPH91421.1 CAP domain-containing protein [Ferruginibacter sp.]
MTKFFVFVFLVLPCQHIFSQAWTSEQLDKANTAKDYDYVTDEEKTIVQYINLCRMYPKQFANNEVKPYTGIKGLKYKGLAKYKASLINELNSRQPAEPLEFDENMYDDAECYAAEISKNRRAAHQRKNCEKGSYAENLYFGKQDGKTIVLEWLIDCGIATLGHRKNCLNKLYGGFGVKIDTHYEYGKCAVGEFGE